MSRLLTRTRLSSIGLDMDPHEIRAVQLAQTSKGVSVLAWAVFPRQQQEHSGACDPIPGEEELGWAASVLGRRGFVGSTVSLAPSTVDCTSHVIELPPFDSGAPLDQLARMEVARARKCAPSHFELGYWELPAKGRTVETLAVACGRPVIDGMIERYRQGGFEPVGIDLLELAIFRGAQASGDPSQGRVEQEVNASLHIGWTSALAVLTVGEKVVYVRRIERGASSVWRIAAERYKLGAQAAQSILSGTDHVEHSNEYEQIRKNAWSGLASDLASDLDVAIAYVNHAHRGAPLGKIRLSGYGVGNPVLEQEIDGTLGIGLHHAAPYALVEAISSDEGGRALAARLTAAYGLAARFDR